jgi:hypothetical protein
MRLTLNLEDQGSVVMSLSDRVSQLYAQAPGSLLVSYESQSYSECILTRLHMRSKAAYYTIL